MQDNEMANASPGVCRATFMGQDAIKICRGQLGSQCGLEIHRDRKASHVDREPPKFLSTASKDFGKRLFVSKAGLIQGVNGVAQLVASCLSRITPYTGTYSSAIKASPEGNLSGLRRGTYQIGELP